MLALLGVTELGVTVDESREGRLIGHFVCGQFFFGGEVS